jgi:hypothetical protein
MDEDEFERERHATRIVKAVRADQPLSETGARTAASTLPRGAATARSRNGVEWVRASDLLSAGAGRVAALGIDVDSELARRLRRTPAVTRRTIQARSHRLPPLSAFGQSPTNQSVGRDGLGRR